ncbi:MAG: XRE family transcriptional regulator [Desulfarculus sp.]|jgi:transcriptional regulator with XRE-family HTH domain|nr:MAG: XRE family transcriptional regulator [Desulfarculus sp.]
MHQETRNVAKDQEYERLLAQEDFIMEVTERVCELMRSKNITRAELANRLGKSKGFVSQLLGGGRNLTLRTLADVLFALEAKPTLFLNEVIEEANDDNVLWRTDPNFWTSCGAICRRQDKMVNTEIHRAGEVVKSERIASM